MTEEEGRVSACLWSSGSKQKQYRLKKGTLEKKKDRVSKWLSKDRKRQLNERKKSKIKQERIEADNKEKLAQLLFYYRQESAVWKRQTMV